MASHVTLSGPSSISENTGVVVSSIWKEHDAERGFADPLLELIAARFRLLGEPVRLKILAVLATGERSVGELVTLTDTGQPNVSKHLAALAQGGLIKRRKVGTSIYYTVADPAIYTLCDVVCASVQQRVTKEAQALGFETVPARMRDAEDIQVES
jgi:DNA-binding transcriptional ArsR family regulator